MKFTKTIKNPKAMKLKYYTLMLSAFYVGLTFAQTSGETEVVPAVGVPVQAAGVVS